jgi:hypothetical protein
MSVSATEADITRPLILRDKVLTCKLCIRSELLAHTFAVSLVVQSYPFLSSHGRSLISRALPRRSFQPWFASSFVHACIRSGEAGGGLVPLL